MELHVLLVALSLLFHGALAAPGYGFDPNYLVPNQCPACDAKSCPQLTYCAGTVVKDNCGCCNRCSSDLFQPHPVNPNLLEPTDESPTESPIPVSGDLCEKRMCPKFKVCVINVQGLPICTCPSDFICRRRGRGGKKNPKTQGPICGTDGVTYETHCYLKIANCNSERRIKRKHDGPCTEADIVSVSDVTNTRLVTTGLSNGNDVGYHTELIKGEIEKSRRGKNKDKRRQQKRKQRKREKKERKRKKQRRVRDKGKTKNKRRSKNKKQRSKRMKRRNEGFNIYPSNYDFLIARNTQWSRSQGFGKLTESDMCMKVIKRFCGNQIPGHTLLDTWNAVSVLQEVRDHDIRVNNHEVLTFWSECKTVL